MIGDVDAALEALVRREAINGSRVDVLFDAPTKDWVARRNAPTIDLYLYDIREDLTRRQTFMEGVRDGPNGTVGQHRMPPRRFRLSYLVTAWTQRPEDEHRLLTALLAAFVRNEYIPFDLVGGSLAGAQFPVLLTVCLPPPQDRSIADVWSALGGELKPSLDVVATAPLDANWFKTAAAPILEEPLLGLGGPGLGVEVPGRAGGREGEGAAARRAIGPDTEAFQEEYIRGGGLGAPRLITGPAPAGQAAAGAGKARAGRRRTTKGAAAEEGAEAAATRAAADAEMPDFAEAGGGRIARIRGVSRP